MGDLGQAMNAERRRAWNNMSLGGGRKGLFICDGVMVFHCAAEGSLGLLMTSDVECCRVERGGEAGGSLKAGCSCMLYKLQSQGKHFCMPVFSCSFFLLLLVTWDGKQVHS